MNRYDRSRWTEQRWADEAQDWEALGNLENVRLEAEKPREQRSHRSADDYEPPSMTRFQRDIDDDRNSDGAITWGQG